MKSAIKILLVTFAVLTFVWLSSSIFTIAETETGIVTRFGRPLGDTGLEPGLHVKAPWPIDSVVRIDSRLLVFDNEPAEMLTLDKKNVLVDSFVTWRVADPIRFAQTVRTRLEAEARLLDLVASELGAAVGAVPMIVEDGNATEAFLAIGGEGMATGTVVLDQVATQAEAEVAALARESFGIEVVDLAINGFNLPRQNRRSVIERMQAERSRIATFYRSEGEQEALEIEADAAAERARILAEAEAEAERVRGAGEAEALALLADAYNRDPEFYRFLRSLESWETIIDGDTTIFLESDSPLLEELDGDG
ncbi:MAG: protease modulator HflC [Acidobacteriota bacterium]